MVVKSHIDHGTAIIDTPEGPREFNVDELRDLHGKPCEAKSRRMGGKGYNRNK